LTTSDETIKRAEAVVQDVLGKHPIRAQDRSGFVVNALLIPYLLSAISKIVVIGNPAQALLDRAKGASLLVVGARGRSGLKATLLGSVSALAAPLRDVRNAVDLFGEPPRG
ncbi:universal stress protein, partial [Streptomyces sp. BE282]|uniref:universal stress protein n=1 Tax=Streptomyces sp. BE282 TaxID=3002527 RepID=UPI002E7A7F7F